MKPSLAAGLLLLAPFALLWAAGYVPEYDLDSDGRIDKNDLYLLQLHWNTSLETPVPTPTNTLTPTGTATPTATPTFGEPVFTIAGVVREFPGCGGAMRGVTITLRPPGRTTESSLFDGSFIFENVSSGEYSLQVSPACNPFGCYPDKTVTVFEDDILDVELCPVAFPPTSTMTWTPTPSPTETALPE